MPPTKFSPATAFLGLTVQPVRQPAGVFFCLCASDRSPSSADWRRLVLLDDQAKNGKISMQGRLMLGRVGAGVVVRSDAPSLEIATTDALKRAMLSADSIVYNTASSGLYLEKLFERIGIAEQIKAKTTR